MRMFCLTVWLGVIASSAVAQTNTAEIGGVVRDASGGVLPGASVTARHPASGTTVARVTDGEGRFFLPALRIGQWEITVTLAGFTGQSQTVTVEIGRSLALDFTLKIAGLAEQVTVEVHVPMLQTTSAEISDVIENRQVVQLPLNGRNFLALAQLSDSVVIPPGGTRGEALQQAGPLPNVGGQRSGHNIYLLDGAKVTDELFNNLVINPSIDSIEEFRIQKSMYPAEFGGKASALINVSTKAGANQFHGSGFEFHRNDAFDATNFFHPAGQPKPPLRQNQFGGAVGGPIVRSRTFFFGSYEGTRLRRSVTRTFTVPSGGAAPRRFLDRRHHLRSVDDRVHGSLRAVCQQSDSVQSHRPDRVGISAAGAAANGGHRVPEPDGDRGDDARPRSVQRSPRSSARAER